MFIIPIFQTALHSAAENDFPVICEVLLQNGADYAAVDNRGNNALHIAVKVRKSKARITNIVSETNSPGDSNPLGRKLWSIYF